MRTEAEYAKYRQITANEITSVERDYLENLKATQKVVAGKVKKDEKKGINKG